MMKKGELRKQEILNMSEMLFCRNGYEQTSVQDIIDNLNLSKGSFYHHYVSKEALLEGICRNRADQIHTLVSDKANTGSPIQNLDILLSGMIPFRDEKLSFLIMLLPVFCLPEGRIIREYYCDALSAQFFPDVVNQLSAGYNSGLLFCEDPENAADLIITIVHSLWVKICMLIIHTEENHEEHDLSECLRATENCRIMIERFLSLPYGTLVLTDIPALQHLIDRIHNHWEKITINLSKARRKQDEIQNPDSTH